MLYFGQLIGSIAIQDIGLIFEFVSAISVSCLAFVFPGVFYLLAEKKFASSFQKAENYWIRMQAYGFIVLGIIAFLIQLTSNIIEIVEDFKAGEEVHVPGHKQ